jgi:biotin operon repressor
LLTVDGSSPEPIGGPADGLAAVMALREMADQLEDASVERAIRAGWSWAQIAEALGVTRQAVHKKHLHRLAAAGLDLRRRHA